MVDETTETKSTGKAAKISAETLEGLTAPFAESKKLPEGVDEETRLFHGVDPETSERVSVTIEGLKAEFGDKLGEKKYMDIAGIAGGSVFFNPRTEATSFRPPLGIHSLRGKHAETVAAILAAKD